VVEPLEPQKQFAHYFLNAYFSVVEPESRYHLLGTSFYHHLHLTALKQTEAFNFNAL